MDFDALKRLPTADLDLRLRGSHDSEKPDFLDYISHPRSMQFKSLIEQPNTVERVHSSQRRAAQNSEPAPVDRVRYDSNQRPEVNFGRDDSTSSPNETPNDEVSGCASLPYFVVGTSAQVAPAMLDRAVVKASEISSGSLLDTWSKYSPTAREYRTMMDTLKTERSSLAAVGQELNENQQHLSGLKKSVQQEITKLEERLNAGTTSKVLPKKIAFLKGALEFVSPEELKSVLGSTKEVNAGQKTFYSGSSVANLLDDLANVYQKNQIGLLNQTKLAQSIKAAEETVSKIVVGVEKPL